MSRKRLFIALIIICLSGLYSYAINSPGDSLTKKNPPFDLVLKNSLDSLFINIFYDSFEFNLSLEALQYQNDDSIPANSDLIYEYRMVKLNKTSPIQLDYNAVVKRYIEMYTVRKKGLSARMLGLAKLYFPIFEEKLDKYDLPLELKYLAIVESALNPLARSKSGAVGLWQFMLNSGKMFDLRIDSYVDERRDPYKSTEAACKYLDYLYRTFNDWQLALAAYNGGPGIVRNAIERSGGKTNFWELRPFLPIETQGYVPAFIAVAYMMNYYAEHDITVVNAPYTNYQVDTVMIKQSLNFSQVTKFVDISLEELKYLNPAYKQNYIPVTEKPEILVLPANKISTFLKYENEILAFQPIVPCYNSQLANAGGREGKVKVFHTVSKGEYLNKIAIQYGCTIEDLKAWNNMQNNSLFSGQQMEVWIDPAHIHRYNISKSDIVIEEKSTESEYFYYVVQKGDSIKNIAQKFNCKSLEELQDVNDIKTDAEVTPGTKIKIVGANN
ncbi:MAG: transglycosylase SLT domain-containing protein [Bacteroidales bacterium]|nr:transglycosylase SLT domain-containing protein [Bacteroidales bacterium]